MQVGHRNACRQGREVRVLLRHVGAGLGRQGIDLRRADAVVEACRWEGDLRVPVAGGNQEIMWDSQNFIVSPSHHHFHGWF